MTSTLNKLVSRYNSVSLIVRIVIGMIIGLILALICLFLIGLVIMIRGKKELDALESHSAD